MPQHVTQRRSHWFIDHLNAFEASGVSSLHRRMPLSIAELCGYGDDSFTDLADLILSRRDQFAQNHAGSVTVIADLPEFLRISYESLRVNDNTIRTCDRIAHRFSSDYRLIFVEEHD